MHKQKNTVWLILMNIILVVMIAVSFLSSSKASRDELRQQNIHDIINMNQSAAKIAAAYFDTQKDRMLDACRYASNKKMSYDELLSYIRQSLVDEKSVIQIVNKEGKGVLASTDSDSDVKLDYSNNDYYDMKKIFSEAGESEADFGMSFSPEFTDNYSGCRSFALYCYVPTYETDGIKRYETLLFVSNTAEFINYLNIDGDYKDFTTVLVGEKGDYIFGNNSFESNNFFQYLYVFNDLTMDKKKEIKQFVNRSGKGELFYQNSKGEDCVFVFSKIPNMDWYCISCVPFSSFHIGNLDMRLSVSVLIILAVLLVVDVAWMRFINSKLRESMIEAEKANDAKTDFLSRMSHDIRTPLNVISGMTYLASKENENHSLDTYLGNILSASKFLGGLVNDILDLNKVESGKMELFTQPYSMEEFMDYLNAIILPLCKSKNQIFTVEKNISDKVILVDSLRFNQIFFNILSNAAKYTPDNGHILFQINEKKLNDDRLQLDFMIRDDGIGMSDEFQNHLFDAFSQENAVKTGSLSGTGLGLAIVKKIVELMDGTVRAESVIGQGSTFYVQLIVTEAKDVLKQETCSIEERDRRLSGKRILLCEDNSINVLLVTKLLQEKDMLVEAFENGKDGMEAFAASQDGYFSAVIMDVQMPVMDGNTATRAIRALNKPDASTIPIIAMTANAYSVDVSNCLEAGMNAHIAKPIEPEKVYDTLATFFMQ